jgi:hypothetical protein
VSGYVAQSSLKLKIFLPLPANYRDYRHELPCQAVPVFSTTAPTIKHPVPLLAPKPRF